MSKYTTGNETRDKAIILALQEYALAGDDAAPTPAKLAPYLPEDMRDGEHCVSDSEIAGFTAGDNSEAERSKPDVSEAVSAPEAITGVLATTEAADNMAAMPEATEAEVQAARDAVAAAHNDLSTARADVQRLKHLAQGATAKLSKCIENFQRGFDHISQSQALHDHANAQLEIRRQQAEGTYPMPQQIEPANSAIDRSRARQVGPQGSERYGMQSRRSGPADTRGTMIGRGAKLPSEK